MSTEAETRDKELEGLWARMTQLEGDNEELWVGLAQADKYILESKQMSKVRWNLLWHVHGFFDGLGVHSPTASHEARDGLKSLG